MGRVIPSPAAFFIQTWARLRLRKPEENGCEVLNAAFADLDALGLEHLDLFLNGRTFRPPLESTHPTG